MGAWDKATVDDMEAFARQDGCLDAMVPSDLRHIVGRYAQAIRALRLYEQYRDTPTDRGGQNGPKGKSWMAFQNAKQEALDKAEGRT